MFSRGSHQLLVRLLLSFMIFYVDARVSLVGMYDHLHPLVFDRSVPRQELENRHDGLGCVSLMIFDNLEFCLCCCPCSQK